MNNQLNEANQKLQAALNENFDLNLRINDLTSGALSKSQQLQTDAEREAQAVRNSFAEREQALLQNTFQRVAEKDKELEHKNQIILKLIRKIQRFETSTFLLGCELERTRYLLVQKCEDYDKIISSQREVPVVEGIKQSFVKEQSVVVSEPKQNISLSVKAFLLAVENARLRWLISKAIQLSGK